MSVKRGEAGRGAVQEVVGRPARRTDGRRPSPHRDTPHSLGPAVRGVGGRRLRFPRRPRGPPLGPGSVSEPFPAPSRAGPGKDPPLCGSAAWPRLSRPLLPVPGAQPRHPRGRLHSQGSGGLAGAAAPVHRRVLVPPSTWPPPPPRSHPFPSSSPWNFVPLHQRQSKSIERLRFGGKVDSGWHRIRRSNVGWGAKSPSRSTV